MTAAALSLVRAPDSPPPAGAVPRRHADRDCYRRWLLAHHTAGVRYNRLQVYDAFVAQWPRLQDWFNAPLNQRRVDLGGSDAEPGAHPHGGPHVLMPYLVYLSLVEGVGLDYELLLVRTFASPFTTSTYPSGMGVDHALFDRHQARLTQLGYSPRQVFGLLSWSVGRLLLHRGDPDLAAIRGQDLVELEAAIEAFAGRSDAVEQRAFYGRQVGRGAVEPATQYRATALQRLQAAHVLLFNIGQIDLPPRAGRRDAGTWTDHLVAADAPPRIAAVIERYLRLQLEANLERPQTVRHARDALRRLLLWLAVAHPEITNLAELTRGHAEEFLRWLGAQRSSHTGAPLALTTRRTIITLLAGFINDTASWHWDDVPGRVLFTRADIPKTPKTLPRFIPDHELDALMTAVDALPDPHQRGALILARWSGARRDEIRRLEVDCLDAYPDGHPRLRIPVGKGHTERSIPLHPQAAEALRPLIEQALAGGAAARYDPTVGRAVRHVFVRRGKLLSRAFLFDASLKTACTTAGMLDGHGRPTVSAHRFRHTIGTQLAEGGARLQTIMAVLGHRSPHMSLIYASLSDPTIKAQYQQALDRTGDGDMRLAGPAADTLRNHELDAQSVHWLQTNFLKTQLELGHCLRLPAEGPCECDLYLACSKFLTNSDYAPQLRARLELEQQLIDDAHTRGWNREVERHQATRRRIAGLLAQLDGGNR